jgi:type I restriction enzyme M protein
MSHPSQAVPSVAAEVPGSVSDKLSLINELRDVGIPNPLLFEHLACLLFLKMTNDRNNRNEASISIPREYSWPTLLGLHGISLDHHYRSIVGCLRKLPDLDGQFFRHLDDELLSAFQLERLIDLIAQETRIEYGYDGMGNLFEQLLKARVPAATSQGQYFIPKHVMQLLTEVMGCSLDQSTLDIACVTGSFLLAAHVPQLRAEDSMRDTQPETIERDVAPKWRVDLSVALNGMMNLHLHGVGGNSIADAIRVGNTLAADPEDGFDIVLSNPPFGRQEVPIIIGPQDWRPTSPPPIVRSDFWAATRNRALNFIQHINTILKIDGKAAVLVPDGVLMARGADEVIRRKLLAECDVHTLLRLPIGIFHNTRVKTSILFFDGRAPRPEPWTRQLWVYDLRSNRRFTPKQNPLMHADFDDFISCYKASNRSERAPTWSEHNPIGSWRVYSYEELLAHPHVNLNLSWLAREPDSAEISLTNFQFIEQSITQYMKIADDHIARIKSMLEQEENVGHS